MPQKIIREVIIRRLIELTVVIFLIVLIVVAYNIVYLSRLALHLNLNNPTIYTQRAALERELVKNEDILSKANKLTPVPDNVAEVVMQLQQLGLKRNSTVNVADIQEEKLAPTPTPKNTPDFKLIPVILHVTAVGSPTNLLALLHDFEYMPYLIEAPSWKIQVVQPGGFNQLTGPETTNPANPICAPGSLDVQLRLYTQTENKI